jgi:hypothetical protein
MEKIGREDVPNHQTRRRRSVEGKPKETHPLQRSAGSGRKRRRRKIRRKEREREFTQECGA